MLTALIREVLEKKWSIFLFVALAAVMATTISILQPKEYLAEASLLPANSRMMDKQRLFGENIQELYSAFGSGEDLDRVFAALTSSLVLQFVVDSLDLKTHYKIKDKNARIEAREKLEDQMKLIRSEYGELRLHIWDKDTVMAAKITDLLIQRTQSVFDEMFQLYYDRSINNLKKELADSVHHKISVAESVFIQNRISEYEVTRLNPPPSFIVMEKPVVSAEPDKPNMLLNVSASILLALFIAFAFIAIRVAIRTA